MSQKTQNPQETQPEWAGIAADEHNSSVIPPVLCHSQGNVINQGTVPLPQHWGNSVAETLLK